METVTGTLKRLNNSIKIGVPIIVNTSIKQLETLLKILEEDQLITTVKTYKTSKAIKIAHRVQRVTTSSSGTKASQLPDKAKELLPNGKGSLILSTNKGLLTHKKAVKQQAGGKIIGIIHQ